MTNNPYAKIKQNSVYTASPQELTLMLYNGAIKFCNQGIVAIEEKDIEKAHNSIRRVQDIIREFQITLDMDYEVAKDFAAMYEYVYNRLSQANRSKDIEMLYEVLGYLREFRDTWKLAMNQAKLVKARAL